MKFKRLLHSGIASLSLVACGVNAATDLGPAGDIHFSITITTKACEMEKSDLEVDMGTMTLQKPAAVGTVLSKKDFTIELKECDGYPKRPLRWTVSRTAMMIPCLPLRLVAQRVLR